VAGDVPAAARRAGGAAAHAHPEHQLGTRQQAQRCGGGDRHIAKHTVQGTVWVCDGENQDVGFWFCLFAPWLILHNIFNITVIFKLLLLFPVFYSDLFFPHCVHCTAPCNSGYKRRFIIKIKRT